MQIMIDTAVDKPATLYKFAVLLAAMYETTECPAEPQDASLGKESIDTLAAAHGLDRREAAPSNVSQLFPPAPPAPPAPASLDVGQPAAPSTVSVEVPPVQPAPPGPAPTLVDDHGVTWDSAQHSTPAKKTMDGKWRARRGLGKVTTDTQPVAGQPDAPSLPFPLPPPVPAAPLPPMPNVPPPPPTAPQAPQDDEDSDEGDVPPVGMDFPTFITHVTTGMSSGSLTQKRIDEVLAKNKIESLFALNGRPDLVTAVAVDFGFPL